MHNPNLRVLIYMNPLVVDKISKRFIYEKDSGFLYTKQLLSELPSNWRYTILVPKDTNREFFPSDRIIDLVEYDYSTSIHQNRYHFNRNIITKLLPYSKDIDVIINNQPEVSANLRVVFENQKREKPIILSFYHWIDCEDSSKFSQILSGYFWRQLDGALNSDVNFFHSKYALSLFMSEVDKNLKNKIEINTGFFYPAPTKFGTSTTDLPDKKIILFNHRCNNSTGWKEVLNICKNLRTKRNDFVLWLTDDSNLIDKSEINKLDFIIQKRLSFDQYGYLIKNAHFAVCNTKGYATWNMAAMDAYYNDCLCLLPDDENGLYKTMFNNGAYHNYKNLEAKIDSYLNMSMEDIKTINNNISLNVPKTNIGETIINIIEEKIKDVNPKKLNEVIEFIKSKIQCEKKEWINNFWSFHANSNFQKIRWKILFNDNNINDNTNEQYTTYIKIK